MKVLDQALLLSQEEFFFPRQCLWFLLYSHTFIYFHTFIFLFSNLLSLCFPFRVIFCIYVDRHVSDGEGGGCLLPASFIRVFLVWVGFAAMYA